MLWVRSTLSWIVYKQIFPSTTRREDSRCFRLRTSGSFAEECHSSIVRPVRLSIAPGLRSHPSAPERFQACHLGTSQSISLLAICLNDLYVAGVHLTSQIDRTVTAAMTTSLGAVLITSSSWLIACIACKLWLSISSCCPG